MTLVPTRLALAGALLCLELAGLALAYQLLTEVECAATSSAELCVFLGSFLARGIAMAAAFLIVLWARPAATRELMLRIELDPGRGRWLWLHAAGVAALLGPVAFAAGGDWGGRFAQALVPWTVGGLAAAVGALLWLAGGSAWTGWLRRIGWAAVAALAAAFLLPDLAEAARPLWDLSVPSRATFEAVHALLTLAGAAPLAWPAEHVIGVDGFYVEIARACSGVEGLALVLGFATIYAVLFRAELRADRFWLLVVPLGLALSWLMNVLRIAALVAIGARLSPELAVNGFHSYAGWMLFTLLAVSLLYAVHASDWLHRGGGAGAASPWLSDWRTACIVPFVALMIAEIAVAAVLPDPALGYPLKLLVPVLALAAFRAAYARLDPSFDALALGSGAAVGLLWLASQPAASPADLATVSAVAGLSGLPLAGWAAARIAGTVLVVPVVEELFFRGYLLARLDRGGAASAGPRHRRLEHPLRTDARTLAGRHARRRRLRPRLSPPRPPCRRHRRPRGRQSYRRRLGRRHRRLGRDLVPRRRSHDERRAAGPMARRGLAARDLRGGRPDRAGAGLRRVRGGQRRRRASGAPRRVPDRPRPRPHGARRARLPAPSDPARHRGRPDLARWLPRLDQPRRRPLPGAGCPVAGRSRARHRRRADKRRWGRPDRRARPAGRVGGDVARRARQRRPGDPLLLGQGSRLQGLLSAHPCLPRIPRPPARGGLVERELRRRSGRGRKAEPRRPPALRGAVRPDRGAPGNRRVGPALTDGATGGQPRERRNPAARAASSSQNQASPRRGSTRVRS